MHSKLILNECFAMHMMTCQILVLGQNTRGVTAGSSAGSDDLAGGGYGSLLTQEHKVLITIVGPNRSQIQIWELLEASLALGCLD